MDQKKKIAFRLFSIEIHSSVKRLEQISIGLTLVISLFAFASFLAISRLFIFHIQLGRMNMTTIEYLNRRPVYDSYESEDEDDEGNKAKRFVRVVTQRIRRTWIRVARRGYHRLNTNSKKPCLPTFTKKNAAVEDDGFFATRTIRPTIVNEQEIDYDDDMGLDMTLLQEKSTSKITKMLDIPEEEALLQLRQFKNCNTEAEMSRHL
ncbi:hypothetical protein BY458DRAFT_125355 [Sporodiniella umbellata]|nr:hypothetical protein BY458DRAFT_125355 [Sporodiniella umbellata]